MSPEARRDEIVKIVQSAGRVAVEELAKRLDASRETIRRDLSDLARQGKVEKYHGGAMLPSVGFEGPFRERMTTGAAAKVRIAQAAARLFSPGETLFVDTGSTTVFFSEMLSNISGLTVVTNSAEIARIISLGAGGSKVFLIGGEFCGDNRETVGSLAVAQIRAFRAHHAVLTIGALDARAGAMDFNIEEAQVARAMIDQAEHVTVLADSSKFDRIAAFEVCALSRIDTLVCEDSPQDALAQSLAAAGVRLIDTGVAE